MANTPQAVGFSLINVAADITSTVDHYTETAFKEYKWYNSHTLGIELQCGIMRLELPIDIVVNSTGHSQEVYVTAQIMCNQLPMHELPITTHFSTVDTIRNAFVWDYVLHFPVKIRDLSLNSILAINAYTSNDTLIGSTTMNFFDDNGKLRRGKQKLLFYIGDKMKADVSVLANNKTPGILYELYSSYDHAFKMEKLLEAYKNSISFTECNINNIETTQQSSWLDRLSLSQIQNILNEEIDRRYTNGIDDHVSSTASTVGHSTEELDFKTFHCLVIEMPVLPYPILHEERLYTENAVSSHAPQTRYKQPSNTIIVDGGRSLEFQMNDKFNPLSLLITADWDRDRENLFEEQYRALSHNVSRGRTDMSIKPNLRERELITKALADARTDARRRLSVEDTELIYKFRYTLVDNKKALIKYLLAVKWDDDVEVKEVPTLLSMWQPVDVADALKLLGRGEAFEHPMIREYAVNILRSASDDELLTYLLQLVQALRYEAIVPQTSNNNVATAVTGLDDYNVIDNLSTGLSPLAKFLIERGCNSSTVANFFYWYLRVESIPARRETDNRVIDDSQSSIFTYKVILDSFITQLDNYGDLGRSISLQLQALDRYMMSICSCQIAAREVPGRKDVKQEALRRLLAERDLTNVPNTVGTVPMPLDPSIQLIGLDPTSARMFASAIYPAVITFYTDESEVTHKMMFKSGDDLRQDQLIMQMVSLMDNLLKKVNLDLKLHTYGILALSKDDGIMEFVTGSDAVSAVLKEYKTLQAYLRHHNYDKNAPYEIAPAAMDAFIKSCAGSCVVTYILGIGDRHLDNIMMRQNGQLFHIDFGFIFGQDPKPLPPPFRFTRHMADCMGGEDSEHYSRFKAYCCQAYNWLRKSADLILNLLDLMADAGINDISRKSTIEKVVELTLQKFRLDLTDEQAEHYFLGLINESLNALAPRLMELAHQIAVSRR